MSSSQHLSSSSLFRTSLIAAAVLAASGCATTAPGNPSDEQSLGSALINVGRATVTASARAVQRTGYLLGLHDDAGNNRPAEAPEMDEVDLALMEEDAVLPPTTAFTQATAQVDSAIRSPVARFVTEPNAGPMAIGDVRDEGLATEEFAVLGTEQMAVPAAIEPQLEEPTGQSTVGMVAMNDYSHTVGDNETLWDIAKLTTGDATNWHILADLNNLAPNAAVHPGQGIVVPADMLRPELAAADVAPDEPAAASPVVVAESTPASAPVVATAADAEPMLVAADTGAERLAIPTRVSPVAPAVTMPADDAKGFRIKAGESLWDFAKRTTGDATNWQAIATQNGFDEMQAVAVREGQPIFVPVAMVRTDFDPNVGAPTSALAAAPVDARPVEIAAVETLADSQPAAAAREAIVDASAMVLTGASDAAMSGEEGILDETREIKIVEAAFRGDDAAPAADDGAPSEILISGTYYPKAIYNDADFTSSLLMRVSPGTRLTVSNVAGPWYEVVTEQGVGYVHNRDIK